MPAVRLGLLCFRSLQFSGYRVPRLSGQLPGSMAAQPRQGIIILTYVLAALELTCLFMQFSILPVSNVHTPHQKPHTAFLLGNGRERARWGLILDKFRSLGTGPQPTPTHTSALLL